MKDTTATIKENARTTALEKLIDDLKLDYDVFQCNDIENDIATAIFHSDAQNTVNNRLCNVYYHKTYIDVIFCNKAIYSDVNAKREQKKKKSKKDVATIEYLKTATIKAKDTNNKRCCYKFNIDERLLTVISDYLNACTK